VKLKPSKIELVCICTPIERVGIGIVGFAFNNQCPMHGKSPEAKAERDEFLAAWEERLA
jgi:hypothetical protein